MADMHPEDIKAAIRKRGRTITALAEAHGLPKQVVSMAISARVSARAEAVIADFIDVPPQAIWPSRYDADGKRIMLRAAPARAA
ncbi:MAG: helix-turn-helix domain-containing protein [Sphingobium sp.]